MKEKRITRESKLSKTIIDFLINIPMFDRIKAEELSVVAKHMNLIELDKNGYVLVNLRNVIRWNINPRFQDAGPLAWKVNRVLDK